METKIVPVRRKRVHTGSWLTAVWVLTQTAPQLWAQAPRPSLSGEQAAEKLKRAAAEEEYNLQYGPVRYQTEAGVAVHYTDNVFRSEQHRRPDWSINPQATVRALWRITDLNTLRFSLGIGYEYFFNNSELNSSAPLISPDSELEFHVFAGQFHIRAHDRFSYQETLFYSSLAPEQDRPVNLTDVGEFARLDNLAGLNVDWDLNQLIISAGYDHENFISYTKRFEYLNRASELFNASANFLIGDKATTGLETQASLNDYERETVLTDHWRARVGPFVDFQLPEGFRFRAGGGYETAQYDPPADRNSNVDTYYAYARVSQDTRFFRHSVSAGREHLLGDNANNLKTIFVRYRIATPVVRNVELAALFSVNFAREFGGAFQEDFTWYRVGARAGWQFHKHLRADLGYDFTLKDSDTALRSFDQHRVTGGVTFRF